MREITEMESTSVHIINWQSEAEVDREVSDIQREREKSDRDRKSEKEWKKEMELHKRYKKKIGESEKTRKSGGR